MFFTGGVRAGKSTRLAFKAFKESLNPRAKLLWLIGPDYPQAREEFRMFSEWALRMKMVEPKDISMPAEGACVLITRFGCRVETRSAQHLERLAGVAPDGVCLCEPGQMPGEILTVVRQRLIERRGWLYGGGTLEDDLSKPRWAWYEDTVSDWMTHREPQEERGFCIPTWTNRTIFPLGEQEPELISARERSSEFIWRRKYGGEPFGVENPAFSLLHESGARDEFLLPCDTDYFENGAIGVDYGRTFEHPSAVVAVQQDSQGRYWVREAWQGIMADVTQIESVVHAFEYNYNIHQGCVDPNQAVLGNLLNYAIAAGGMSTTGKPSEMRISLTNGLFEQRALYFDMNGQNVDLVYESLKNCARIRNVKGELVFNRPLGDDFAQALMYAIELLRGESFTYLPVFESVGGVVMSYDKTGGHEGFI